MNDEFIEYVPIVETHNAGDRVFIKSILDAEDIRLREWNKNVLACDRVI